MAQKYNSQLSEIEQENQRLREQINDSKDLWNGYLNSIRNSQREMDSLIAEQKDAVKKAEESRKVYEEHLKNSGKTEKDVKDFEKQVARRNELKKRGNDNLTETEKKELKELNEYINDNKELNDLYKEKLNVVRDTNEALKDTNKTIDSSKKKIKEGFGDIKQGFSQIHGVAKDFMDVWAKADKAASNFAKSIGTSAAGMRALRANSIQSVAQSRIGAKYNVSADELLGIQNNYAKEIGRNALISSLDQENMAAMQATMGEEGMKLAAAFENFGLSYTNAAERAGKMFQTASKYGISYDKYVQNVQQGLKIAQSYTFSNGLKGMQEMAKKATAIKLDMQQITAFANKVNTVQGAIETGARLQTLGGPFAQMGDPLGMLSDSLNGVEGLLDRFTKMTGGLGRFNSNTGEMEVSAFNKRRLQAAAEAMGMDYGQVMESVQAQGRKNYVANILKRRGNTNQEDIDFLSNAATIENGQAKVSFVDKNNKKQTVNLSERDLTDKERELVKKQNQEQSDDIKDIAQNLRSWDDVKEGLIKQYNNNKAVFLEKSGIADSAKSIARLAGLSNGLLAAILGVVGGGKILGGLGKAGKGLAEMRQGDKGLDAAKNIGKGLLGKGKGLGKKIFSSVGGSAGVGASGLLAGTAIAGWGLSQAHKQNQDRKDGLLERGSKKDNNKTLGNRTLIGTGTGMAVGGAAALLGASLGSAVPVIGTAIGAALGLGVGIVTNKINKKAKERKAQLKQSGFELKGDYRNNELKKIQKATADGRMTKEEFYSLSDKTQKKMIENGDASLFPDLAEIVTKAQEAKIDADAVYVSADKIVKEKNSDRKANGGLLNGPSHANGGMPIVGSNIEVEGGEFVVNKRSAAKYMGLLNTINTMSNGGIIRPRRMETGGALTVTPKTINDAISNASVGVKDINLNINGSIKLEGGKGQSVDISNEILKDPQFIRKITRMIEEQMGINKTGGRLVNKGLY